MARVHLKTPEELTGEAKKAYDELNAKGKITNMKLVMLQDYGTYRAFMGWYDSWASLEQAVGLRAATIYAHSVSTTNGCMLCSLFFISDLKELGLDPNNFETSENEKLLQQLGQQIVKDPTKVSDELLNGLRKFYTDEQIIIIVGFGAQMQATNNFNSVLGVDVDARLLPLKDQFKPATWRDALAE
jgi:alkylhydroperoxidase family enzyme